MRRPTLLEIVIITLVAALLLPLLYSSVQQYRGARQGRADAMDDIESGKLGLKCGGRPRPWRKEFSRLALDRYGVEVEFVCGCCPDDYTSSYMYEYNRVMEPFIEDRVGRFPYNELRDEAESLWEKANLDTQSEAIDRPVQNH